MCIIVHDQSAVTLAVNLKAAASALEIQGCIGALLGQALPVDLTGIDFAMTALFTVILVEQVRVAGQRLPALIGGVSALVMLLLLGPEAFLLPSLLVTVTLLVCGRGLLVRKGAAA